MTRRDRVALWLVLAYVVGAVAAWRWAVHETRITAPNAETCTAHADPNTVRVCP